MNIKPLNSMIVRAGDACQTQACEPENMPGTASSIAGAVISLASVMLSTDYMAQWRDFEAFELYDKRDVINSVK